MNSYFHAKAAAKRWGGKPEDYLEIETFIDSSKEHLGDVRHRALYHHTAGIFLCARIFGATITVQRENGEVQVPVRLIAEQHVIEDLGWIPSPNDYWKSLPIEGWMSGAKLREEPLSVLGLTTRQEAAIDDFLDHPETGVRRSRSGITDIFIDNPRAAVRVQREMNERATFTTPYRELTDDEEAAENATWD